MFAARMFAPRMFAPRYFAENGATASGPSAATRYVMRHHRRAAWIARRMA